MKAKAKGNNYELETAKKFRKYFPDVCSSRSESKSLDDKGVDLCYTGMFSVQCKATEKAPSYHTLLETMPKDSNMNLVFHKRNRKGTVVVMKEEDFFEILEMLRWAGVV